MMRNVLLLCLLGCLGGCVGYPPGVQPVESFELPRYLGTWYEIARLDHRFERGLEQVTAEYTLNDDGSVRVTNRGYSATDGTWETAVGKARFVEREDLGYLKVSFFGPFYGSYVVFGLDAGYQRAYVSGPDHEYLWLLARTPQVSEAEYAAFIAAAKAAGFATDELIRVTQTEIPAGAAAE